ncbi:MAG TPA: PhzF family phenazine biosynthesis isomerase, partial [Beijerinckiaceae bacterium]|nr:PhzF family phenazine biosynthesis isomerase [Beijerinckiaceae bacterium]
MRRKFHTLDVFTEHALAGNPLAVVLDCDGLDDNRMQAIAREFNLSETVFVLEPADPVNTAKIRIFTPSRELPFAGHPTIGAAILIAELRAPELLAASDVTLVLEEGIGLVTCSVRHRPNQGPRASF